MPPKVERAKIFHLIMLAVTELTEHLRSKEGDAELTHAKSATDNGAALQITSSVMFRGPTAPRLLPADVALPEAGREFEF